MPDDVESPDDDAGRWREAEHLRTINPGWVVIWLARVRKFRAYRDSGSRRVDSLTAATADELATQIRRLR